MVLTLRSCHDSGDSCWKRPWGRRGEQPHSLEIAAAVEMCGLSVCLPVYMSLFKSGKECQKRAACAAITMRSPHTNSTYRVYAKKGNY